MVEVYCDRREKADWYGVAGTWFWIVSVWANLSITRILRFLGEEGKRSGNMVVELILAS